LRCAEKRQREQRADETGHSAVLGRHDATHPRAPALIGTVTLRNAALSKAKGVFRSCNRKTPLNHGRNQLAFAGANGGSPAVVVGWVGSGLTGSQVCSTPSFVTVTIL